MHKSKQKQAKMILLSSFYAKTFIDFNTKAHYLVE